MQTLPCKHCPLKVPSEVKPETWDFVPLVVCISLKERPERTQEALHQFHRVGLCQRVRFYRPARDRENGIRGCWESHRTVMKYGLSCGASHMLIFEDDVLFDPKVSTLIVEKMRHSFLHLPSNWDLYFLGQQTVLAVPTAANTMRTWSVCCHAYVVCERYMKRIADLSYRKAQLKAKKPEIDVHMRDDAIAYSFFPMIAYQSTSESSMDRKGLQKMLQVMMSNPEFMSASQYLALTLFILIVLIIIVGIVLLCVYLVPKKPSESLQST